MKRKLMKDLISWKNSSDRKPLIIWGARQVGKTWLMQEFGKEYYSDYVYISFFKNEEAQKIFTNNYNVERIVEDLEIISHKKIIPGETLIIFDEIQDSLLTLESLKSFCEDAPEYHIVAAGSLLGVALHDGISFPVGKVDELHLYPMSFSEFLLALGEEKLSEEIYNYSGDIVKDFSNTLYDYYKRYSVVGGMPQAVLSYIKEKDFEKVRDIQSVILMQYERDFGKHAKDNELLKIRMLWNSISSQLSKENKKFFFSSIKKGARLKEYESAIEWLKDAGLIYKVNKVTKPGMPLKSYEDISSFKIYMNDIGLLGAHADLSAESILSDNETYVEFKGAMAEQYVLQEIKANYKNKLYYFSSDKSSFEVDYIVQIGSDVIPVEVKSGGNVKSKSLKFYYNKYLPSYTIRFSILDFEDEGWVKNIPLWSVCGVIE